MLEPPCWAPPPKRAQFNMHSTTRCCCCCGAVLQLLAQIDSRLGRGRTPRRTPRARGGCWPGPCRAGRPGRPAAPHPLEGHASRGCGGGERSALMSSAAQDPTEQRCGGAQVPVCICHSPSSASAPSRVFILSAVNTGAHCIAPSYRLAAIESGTHQRKHRDRPTHEETRGITHVHSLVGSRC